MDPKDYRITVAETFDRIEGSLRRRAVETVESIRGGERLVLQTKEFSELALASDPDAQRVIVSIDTAIPARFYYHEIEEQWFEERTEESLGDAINRLLATATGNSVTIPKEDLL
jgi:frataxin-like iron-binding protein CyaY